MKSLQHHSIHQQLSAAKRLGAALTSTQTIASSIAKPNQNRALHQQACCRTPRHVTQTASRRASRVAHPGNRRELSTNRISLARSSDFAAFTSKATMGNEPKVHDIFEPVTGTWQYVVADEATSKAVIIDPVLNYDPVTQAITTTAADSLLALVNEHDYHIKHILETHAHADHLTAASYLQSRLARQQGHKPLIGIGKRIVQVQRLFGQRYGVPAEEYGVVFDKLFDDDEMFDIGGLKGKAIHLPGHTPDHLGYMIGDNIFCGDSIFHADIGTARCDFPGGSANDLFRSGRKLLSMPEHVKIWTGHDYPPEGRPATAYMTVSEHRERNKHLSDGISEEEYVAMRKARDAQMSEPRLLHQSLQVNIRGGHMPNPTEAGLRLLHLPLKLKAVEGWDMGVDSIQAT